MQVNEELKKYIDENVLKEYNKNEIGHGINHIHYVIDRSFELIKENNLDVNNDMVYTIAAYHDIGHHKELTIIKEAIEDHRASMEGEPRSIYGKIVSSADRNNTVEDCLSRTYTYGKKLNPNATDEELFLRAYDVLSKKFGENGYAKFYFKDKKYEEFLKEIRNLLKDKENYINTQRNYIMKLKKQKKI